MRKPMVTRTITSTLVNVLCMDIEKAEPFNQSVIVPRTFDNDEKLMKIVRKMVDNEHIKAVTIVGTEIKTALYGMSEEDFVKSAKLLDNETRKPIEE